MNNVHLRQSVCSKIDTYNQLLVLCLFMKHSEGAYLAQCMIWYAYVDRKIVPPKCVHVGFATFLVAKRGRTLDLYQI